jgi:hypothetical protein
MYHADEQDGSVGMGEVAEHDSCIGHPPCYSYPSSAESHFVNDVPGFPMAFAARGMTNCNQPDEKGTSWGPGSEILNSEVAITNNQFAPSVRQAHAGSIRPAIYSKTMETVSSSSRQRRQRSARSLSRRSSRTSWLVSSPKCGQPVDCTFHSETTSRS